MIRMIEGRGRTGFEHCCCCSRVDVMLVAAVE